MTDLVFISDLHLNPADKSIEVRFNRFINWIYDEKPNALYILGDFLHVWPGDDAMDAWSNSIADRIHQLVDSGIQVFYMAGNRDFLLGNDFAARAGWSVLQEPHCLSLDGKQVVLVHGDRYCTKDKKHQRFRRLTRNALFPKLFLKLPLVKRVQMVDKVRTKSMQDTSKTMEQMDVVEHSVISHMNNLNADILIHGHTHKPGLTTYTVSNKQLFRYVLSDWDDNPKILCYNKTNGFYFYQFN